MRADAPPSEDVLPSEDALARRDGPAAVDGATVVCAPGVRSCGSPTSARVCSSDGTAYVALPCGALPNATAQCAGAGLCVPTCNVGFGDCDGSADNGCEALLATDAAHCGACGRACAAGQRCAAGVCGAAALPRYVRSMVSSTYVDACMVPGATRIFVAGEEDISVRAVLAFDFNFWGRRVPAATGVFVSSNGFLSAGPTPVIGSSGSIPSVIAPNATVAAFWRYLTVGSGVCAATLGAPGERRAVFTWSAMRTIPVEPGTVSVSIIVHEGTDVIDLAFGAVTVATTSLATSGLENFEGTEAIGACGGGTRCGASSGVTVRFTPSP